METRQPKRYEELDALRGIAALMVVFFHFTVRKPPYDTFFKLGTTGVDLFFMISGFVIFMSLQKIKNSTSFIINRVSRLYPTYWASVTFTMLVIAVYFWIAKDPLIDLKQTFIHYLGNMTMFQFYLRIPNIDGPYWTMIIEMVFYISILLLYHFKRLRYLNGIAIVLCALSVIGTRYFENNTLFYTFIHGFPLLQFIPLFFAGTVFYKIYTERKALPARYLILLYCFICQLALFPYVGGSHFYISQAEYNVMLSAFFMAFILFVNHRLLFIVNPVTLFLGKISYALYLTHQFISLTVLIPLLVGYWHIHFWVATLLIILPLVIGIAALITYGIEIPYGKKMKTFLHKKWPVNGHGGR